MMAILTGMRLHLIDLYFSNNWRCGASFHVPVDHLYVFFGEMSVKVFCPFFDWVVCFFVYLRVHIWDKFIEMRLLGQRVNEYIFLLDIVISLPVEGSTILYSCEQYI